MTTDELSRIAANGTRGWLSTDHVSWAVKHLNSVQSDTIFICPNAVINIEREMLRHIKRLGSHRPKRFVFVINVGNNPDGSVYTSTWGKSGNHWVNCIVELDPQIVLYCDSLASYAPLDIVDTVNTYIRNMPNYVPFNQSHLELAHIPSTSPHKCVEKCRNYPLQSCSDICGVISLIIAGSAALDENLFHFLCGDMTRTKIYLQSPSIHRYFLRRVLMMWFAKGSIDIDIVSPKALPQTSPPLSKNSSYSGSSIPPQTSTSTHNTSSQQPAFTSSKQQPPNSPSVSPQPSKSKDNKQQKQLKATFICSECNVEFLKLFNLKRHFKRKHPLKTFEYSNTGKEKSKCVCNECSFICYRISDLREHLKRSHGFEFQTDRLDFKTIAGMYLHI